MAKVRHGRPRGSQPLSSTCQCQALCGDTQELSLGVLPAFLGERHPAPFTGEEAEAPRGRSLNTVTQGDVASPGATPGQAGSRQNLGLLWEPPQAEEEAALTEN